MSDILVGAPVWKRAWILRPWFLCVEDACEAAGLTPSYCFVVDNRDRETAELLQAVTEHFRRDLTICWVNEDGNRDDIRDWTPERFHHMVWLRNDLLARVRQLAPPLFLSLDSDILLNEHALVSMLPYTEQYAAVGSKCYLSARGRHCPNYAMLINADAMARNDLDRGQEVDVLMAIKLMTPDAYAVDYAWHWKGEDAGWSKAVRHKGLKLWWDGGVISKHVWDPSRLDEIDVRCGY